MKRKVTLHMKNGQSHNLICENDQLYNQLLKIINTDDLINITSNNKTISIKGSNVDYHESEAINNTKDLITPDGYATQKLIDLMMKKRKK